MFMEYIPEIEFEANCPMCENPLVREHYWSCTACAILWEPDGTEGRYISEDEELEEDELFIDDL